MLEKARQLVNEFCIAEYESEADFTDLTRVGLAYTTTGDNEENEVQVCADLVHCTMSYYIDDARVRLDEYDSLEYMIAYDLEFLDFNELYHTAMEAYSYMMESEGA